jgi:hypothetical protein
MKLLNVLYKDNPRLYRKAKALLLTYICHHEKIIDTFLNEFIATIIRAKTFIKGNFKDLFYNILQNIKLDKPFLQKLKEPFFNDSTYPIIIQWNDFTGVVQNAVNNNSFEPSENNIVAWIILLSSAEEYLESFYATIMIK